MTLRDRIEAQIAFEATIRNNHIELLLAMKQRASNCEEFRASISVASNNCGVCLNCEQHNYESLSDFTRSFKAAREIIQLHIGDPILVTKAIEETHLAHF